MKKLLKKIGMSVWNYAQHATLEKIGAVTVAIFALIVVLAVL